jgi:uncharacterized protein (TIGR02466 family)
MNYKLTPLFAIPLYQAILSTEHNIDDFTYSIDYERMPANNGDYSCNNYILNEPRLLSLKSEIQSHIDYFLYELLDCKTDIQFHIENSWINKHDKNDFAGVHRHSNSLISGVYYISVDNNSGSIVFQKDKSYYNLWNEIIDIEFNYQTHTDQSKLNVFNAEGWGVTPKNNELILFPSHLYHLVTENNSEKTRYSLAFNVFPRGKIGGKLNTLRL